MKHNFVYKLIDRIDPDIMVELKKLVKQGPFIQSNDFQPYTLTITPLDFPFPAMIDLFDRHMYKFFTGGGHVGSNVAKMVPGAYVPEHSDYIANTYGTMQDSIIKFQIPIITNPGAGLMWRWDEEDGQGAQSLFLEEGGIYMFDNCRVHSSANFGTQDRYWITSRWRADCLTDKSILE